MLHALEVSRVALLSNNPDKVRQLRRFGIPVTAQVPTGVHLCAANGRYLATKVASGAHTLEVEVSAERDPVDGVVRAGPAGRRAPR